MKKLLVLFLLLPAVASAEIRVNLLTRLNQYMDDSTNWKMSQANKILFLDATARELGRSFLYSQDTTVVTAANTDAYTMPSDFAGAIKAAYIRSGTARAYLRVGDPEIVREAESPSPGNVQYAYIGAENELMLEAIPLLAETLIVSYFAIPAALSGDSTEWDLPDEYEDAALRITASKCLVRIPIPWQQERSQFLYQTGWADIERLKNSTPRTVKMQDAATP
jgi:hypothetical protein